MHDSIGDRGAPILHTRSVPPEACIHAQGTYAGTGSPNHQQTITGHPTTPSGGCVGWVRNPDSSFLATPKGPNGVLHLPLASGKGSSPGWLCGWGAKP